MPPAAADIKAWTKIDFNKIGFDELREMVQHESGFGTKKVLLHCIWNRADFKKIDKLNLLADVLKNGTDLDCVEYAARRFHDESKLNYKYLLVSFYLDWWKENRPKYVEKESTPTASPLVSGSEKK